MYEFRLPDLGEGVHEGEILKWYVEVGQEIKEDDPLVDIETDKAAVTIPSPQGGKILSRAGDVGEVIKVGAVVVTIDTDGAGGAALAPAPTAAARSEPASEARPEPATPAARPAAAALPAEVTAAPPPATAPLPPAAATSTSPARGPVPAAPATRRLARELGVDINRVPPSGLGGRITADDVRRFVERQATGAPEGEAPAAAPPVTGIPFLEIEPLPDFAQWGEVERAPVRSIRRKVARKMVTSMVLVPHVAHMDEADVTELEAFRRREKATRRGEGAPPITMLAIVMKAVAVQLKRHPGFNASVDPAREEIIYKKYINIGFAADTERGLIVPVVKNADRLSIREMSSAIYDLAIRAREGKIDVSDLQGGTFTITNVGALGGTFVVPTINYPEVAILGMGRVRERPVVREGEVAARHILPLTLTFDHRIVDGADGARFTTALVQQLSDPLSLLVEVS